MFVMFTKRSYKQIPNIVTYITMHILALGFCFLSLPSSYFATSFSTHHHYYRRHTQHLYTLITACLLCKGNCRSLLSAKESSSLHSYVPSLCPCLSLKEMLPGRPRVNTIHKSLNTTHESANKSCRGQAGGLGGGMGGGTFQLLWLLSDSLMHSYLLLAGYQHGGDMQ